MIFLLNTSIDSHWCALFDATGTIVAQCVWTDRKRGVNMVHGFIEAHRERFEVLEWCGGIAGPGGFSSLRAASVMMNTIAWKHGVGVRTCTAIELGRAHCGAESFALNCFGATVFVCEKGLEYERVGIETLEKYEGCVGFLPTEKQPETKKQAIEPETLMYELFEVLRTKKKNPAGFVPEYFFEAVT